MEFMLHGEVILVRSVDLLLPKTSDYLLLRTSFTPSLLAGAKLAIIDRRPLLCLHLLHPAGSAGRKRRGGTGSYNRLCEGAGMFVGEWVASVCVCVCSQTSRPWTRAMTLIPREELILADEVPLMDPPPPPPAVIRVMRDLQSSPTRRPLYSDWYRFATRSWSRDFRKTSPATIIFYSSIRPLTLQLILWGSQGRVGADASWDTPWTGHQCIPVFGR